MAANQIDPKARKFINDHRLAPFVFLADPGHQLIDRYGIRNTETHEAIEQGVPHPTTYLLDRDGTIRLKDTRKNYTHWLAASVLREALKKAGS